MDEFLKKYFRMRANGIRPADACRCSVSHAAWVINAKRDIASGQRADIFRIGS